MIGWWSSPERREPASSHYCEDPARKRPSADKEMGLPRPRLRQCLGHELLDSQDREQSVLVRPPTLRQFVTVV